MSEENEDLDTNIEVSTINSGFSVLTNGQPGTLDFANSKQEFTRFFVVPLGKPQNDETEEITASVFIQDRNNWLSAEERSKIPFCISL